MATIDRIKIKNGSGNLEEYKLDVENSVKSSDTSVKEIISLTKAELEEQLDSIPNGTVIHVIDDEILDESVDVENLVNGAETENPQFLATNRTNAKFVPTQLYHPATKEYVDTHTLSTQATSLIAELPLDLK